MKGLKNYKLKLTALSPIHIGTGEVYEPTNFVIDGGFLYEFDEVLFYKSLSESDKKDFNSCVNNWMSIIRFYKKNVKKAKQVAISKIIVSDEIKNKYKTIININGTMNNNQLMIEKSYKNVNTNRAIIPGSSFKGFFTTILNIFEKVGSIEDRQNLIVSDANLVEGQFEIGYSHRIHRRKSDQKGKGIPQMVEVVSPGSVFLLSISSKYTFESLKRGVEKFYIDRDKDYRAEKNNKIFIGRIGKYCGKENVVFNTRNMLNSYNKPLATRSVYSSNTLNNEMFGLYKIELIDNFTFDYLSKKIKNEEDKYYKNIDNNQENTLKAIKENEKQVKEKNQKIKFQ